MSPLPAADLDLKRRIENFLASRNYPSLCRLNIDVIGGQVVVSGRVGSFYEKQLAGNCTQRVAGVLEVVNDVEVSQPQARCRCHEGAAC